MNPERSGFLTLHPLKGAFMRLGQFVYWLDIDRPDKGGATIRVREGRYFRHDGDTFAVLLTPGVPGGTCTPELIVGKMMFTDVSAVEIFAMGWAVRLVRYFNYPSAVAINSARKVIHAEGALSPVPSV